MKVSLLLSALALSLPVFAQTALPPGYNHPPMAGHGAAGTAQPAAPAPYRFQPYGTPQSLIPPQVVMSNEGTVISAQTTGGYTYIEVTSPSGNTWLAAPESKVAVGEKIAYPSGAVMRNFTSKSVGRTFPAIIFVSGITQGGSNAAPTAAAAPHGALSGPAGLPPPPPAEAETAEGVVVSTQNAGGYSYIEVKGANGNTWLAAPMAQLKAGDTVRYEPGSVMRNFSSRALNRTFPEIVFVDRVTVAPAK